jgi:signal transduction histidine kinase
VAELVAVAAAAAVDLRLDLPDGTWDGVSAAVALTAYRICREAVTNTLRHSATVRAELAVSRRDGALRLRYLDHGPPRPPAPGAVGGHGIAGMTTRARSLGGTLRAGRCGVGHLVEAELPLHPAVNA